MGKSLDPKQRSFFTNVWKKWLSYGSLGAERYRKNDIENCPFGAAFSIYLTIMVLNYFFAHSKTYTCACIFRFAMQALKYIEDLLGMLLFKAYTVVGKSDLIILSGFTAR